MSHRRIFYIVISQTVISFAEIHPSYIIHIGII